MRRVVITGMGIVSSIGNNTQEVLSSLHEAKSGISHAAKYKELGFRSQVQGAPTLNPSDVIDRRDLTPEQPRPLDTERWAGAVDCVGGPTLAHVLRTMRAGGLPPAGRRIPPMKRSFTCATPRCPDASARPSCGGACRGSELRRVPQAKSPGNPRNS